MAGEGAAGGARELVVHVQASCTGEGNTRPSCGSHRSQVSLNPNQTQGSVLMMGFEEHQDGPLSQTSHLTVYLPSLVLHGWDLQVSHWTPGSKGGCRVKLQYLNHWSVPFPPGVGGRGQGGRQGPWRRDSLGPKALYMGDGPGCGGYSTMPPQEVLCPPLPHPGAPTCSLGPHLAVHVGFGPGDVMVMVDDHGPAEHMQVFHHVLLGICQCGDLCVVAWLGREWLWMQGAHSQPPTALGWKLPWVRHWVLLLLRPPTPKAPGGWWCCKDMKAWPCLDLGEPPFPPRSRVALGAAGPQVRAQGCPSPPAGLSCREAPHGKQLCPGSFNFLFYIGV